MSAYQEAKRRSTILDWIMHSETLLVKGSSDASVVENLMTFKGADPHSAEKIVMAQRNSGPRFVLNDEDYKLLVADLMENAVMNATFRTQVGDLRAMMDSVSSSSTEASAPAQPKKKSGSGILWVVLGGLLAVIGVVVLGGMVLTGDAWLAPLNLILWGGSLLVGLILLGVGVVTSM
jgi:type IV secretory pathway VirB2 component (pilin)